MIRSIVAASEIPLNHEDVEICHRVFNRICVERRIEDDLDRQDLAANIIHNYQHGVRDEDSLLRLFS